MPVFTGLSVLIDFWFIFDFHVLANITIGGTATSADRLSTLSIYRVCLVDQHLCTVGVSNSFKIYSHRGCMSSLVGSEIIIIKKKERILTNCYFIVLYHSTTVGRFLGKGRRGQLLLPVLLCFTHNMHGYVLFLNIA